MCLVVYTLVLSLLSVLLIPSTVMVITQLGLLYYMKVDLHV